MFKVDKVVVLHGGSVSTGLRCLSLSCLMKASAFSLKVGDESGGVGEGQGFSRDPLLAMTHPIRENPSQEGGARGGGERERERRVRMFLIN